MIIDHVPIEVARETGAKIVLSSDWRASNFFKIRFGVAGEGERFELLLQPSWIISRHKPMGRMNMFAFGYPKSYRF